MKNQEFEYQPIGDRIVILRDKPQEVTGGGVIIPVVAQELPLEGTIVALGTAGNFTVSIGQRALFSSYSGIKLNVEGPGDYLVLREGELLCVRAPARDEGTRKNGAAVLEGQARAR